MFSISTSRIPLVSRCLSYRHLSNAVATAQTTKFLMQKDDAWNFVPSHKDVIGNRALIVTSSDAISQQHAQKMWFHLQANGIQSTYHTIRTAFVDSTTIDDGLAIMKRANASSLIAIGSRATYECAQAMKITAEKSFGTAKNTINKLRSLDAFGSVDDIRSIVNVPLVTVSNEYSPSAAIQQFRVFHPQENVVIPLPGAKSDVVIFDSSVTSAYPTNIPSTPMALSLAFLFETLMSFSVTSLSQGMNKETLVDTVQEIIQSMNMDDISASSASEDCSQAQLAIFIARIRNELLQRGYLDCRHSPDVISSISTLRDVQFIGRYRIQRPPSWTYLEMASGAVDLFFDAEPDARSAIDEVLLEAYHISMDLVSTCADTDKDRIVALLRAAHASIISVCNGNKKAYVPGNPVGKVESVGPQGLLEGLIITEEEDVDKIKLAKNKYAELGLAGVYQSKAKGPKKIDIAKIKLEVLKSDFMSAYMEQELKKYS